MSTKIAVCHLNNRVAPRFDQCAELVLATVDSHTTAQLHQEFTLRVETERLHLFDKETQAAF